MLGRFHAFVLASALQMLQTVAQAQPADALAKSTARDPDRLGFSVPDFAKLQSGGYSGTMTVGVGYAAFQDRLNVAVLYGYVPPGRGRSVHSLHVVLSLRPYELGARSLRWVPLYSAFGTLWTRGSGYFITVPKRYPQGYYYPTAVRLTALLGSELDWLPATGSFERHGVYVELTTLDAFVLAYVRNPHVVELSDIVSSSVGYRAAF